MWSSFASSTSRILTTTLKNRRFSTRNVNGNKLDVPRRAILYVPGNDVKKIAKVAVLNVDCVVLDCEDGVAANKKEEARYTIAKMLGDGVDLGRAERSVRINSIDSGLAEQDLQCVMSASRKPSTIMVPKVESVGHIDWIADRLRRYNSSASSPVNLVIFAESARALLDLDVICQHAARCHRGGPFVLDAIVFGSDDFCSDIGASRTPSAIEVLYARQRLVTVAKAHRLQAIDMVYIDYKDLIGLKKQSLEGARMGFTGKQVIHPGQIDAVQEAFAPSDATIEWATQLTEAFREHQSSGKGAFDFRGSMIDMPLLRKAENIVRLAHVIRQIKRE